jgi:hypothetical protein
MQNIGKNKVGRKPGPVKPDYLKRYKISFLRLPGWMIKWLKAQEKSSGALVEKALIEYYNLKSPKEISVNEEKILITKIQKLIDAGRITRAVQVYRQITGVGLDDARKIIAKMTLTN